MEQERNHHQSGDQALQIARGASHETLAALLQEVARLQLAAFDCGADGRSKLELALHLGDDTPILNLLNHFVATIPLERRTEFLSSWRGRGG